MSFVQQIGGDAQGGHPTMGVFQFLRPLPADSVSYMLCMSPNICEAGTWAVLLNHPVSFNKGMHVCAWWVAPDAQLQSSFETF